MKKGSFIYSFFRKKAQLPLKSMMAISCAVLFALLTFALSPLLTYLNTDVLFYSTPLPIALDIFIKVIENVVFAISYALVIYSAVFYTPKKTLALGGIYLTATLTRKLATVGMAFLFSSAPDTAEYHSLGFTFCAELIQIAAVIAFALMMSSRYNSKLSKENKAAIRLGDLSFKARLDFASVFSPANPLHISALFASIMISSVNVIQRIIYDLFYGAPADLSEVLIMAAYYLIDVLLGLIIYAGIWFISSFLFKADPKQSNKN